jgi:long-chain fatty acid transport protein
MGDWSYTQWSSLQEVAIAFQNPLQQPNPAVEEFQWTDTSFWSLGAEYSLNDQWTLRAGYAQDSRRRAMKTRTPRACRRRPPVALDRRHLGSSEHWEISAGYTRIETDDPTVNLARRWPPAARRWSVRTMRT